MSNRAKSVAIIAVVIAIAILLVVLFEKSLGG